MGGQDEEKLDYNISVFAAFRGSFEDRLLWVYKGNT